MEISKEQIAKMAESYKKAETQHVAQRAVTKNGILESAESVEVLKRMSPKNFAFSIDVDDQGRGQPEDVGPLLDGSPA